mmetsp:Transcript_54736/g.127737  ORF Transcript_54736/g.127737 Transcript_54736/m.127737 type:complete len:259 (+) Transcript_54736:72-848(+)
MRGRSSSPYLPEDVASDEADWRRLRTPSPEVGCNNSVLRNFVGVHSDYQGSELPASSSPSNTFLESGPSASDLRQSGNQTAPDDASEVQAADAFYCQDEELLPRPIATHVARPQKRAQPEARPLPIGLVVPQVLQPQPLPPMLGSVRCAEEPGGYIPKAAGTGSRKNTGSFSSKDSWMTWQGSSSPAHEEVDREFGTGGPIPLPSRGSDGHPTNCKPPCKYVRKSRGCKDGENCERCHLCPWRGLRASLREHGATEGG